MSNDLVVKFNSIAENAKLPTQNEFGGYTLYCNEAARSVVLGINVCKTGIGVDIPEGYIGLVHMPASFEMNPWQYTKAAHVIYPGDTNEITLTFHDGLSTIDRAQLCRRQSVAKEIKANESLIDVQGLYQSGSEIAVLTLVAAPRFTMEPITVKETTVKKPIRKRKAE